MTFRLLNGVESNSDMAENRSWKYYLLFCVPLKRYCTPSCQHLCRNLTSRHCLPRIRHCKLCVTQPYTSLHNGKLSGNPSRHHLLYCRGCCQWRWQRFAQEMRPGVLLIPSPLSQTPLLWTFSWTWSNLPKTSSIPCRKSGRSVLCQKHYSQPLETQL